MAQTWDSVHRINDEYSAVRWGRHWYLRNDKIAAEDVSNPNAGILGPGWDSLVMVLAYHQFRTE